MICQQPGCTEHYGCRLQAKGLQVTPTSSPAARRPFKPRPMVQPSWEKGRAGSHRRDGSFMPLLNDNGRAMGVKEASERRPEIDAALRRHANS